MRLKILFGWLFLWAAMAFGQLPDLTPLSKISVLTCGTGDELSSRFGHTAFRIQDPSKNLDIVLGYGGFDFEDPNFYWKFTTGKLDYTMTGHRYPSFLNGYKMENRWVSEQVLNLSLDQKNALFDALKGNFSIENWGYKYDFLFDNCATRIPDLFKKTMGDQLKYEYTHLTDTQTFRQLIHETLTENAWSTFGIDLALGAVIDRKATPWEHQFLPLYVSSQLANTRLNGEPLANEKNILLEKAPIEEKGLFILSPLFFGILLLVFVVLKTYNDHKKNKRTRWVDFVLFFLTGAAGILIFFLWFMTDHSATKLNFNILWAIPLNVIVAFLVVKAETPPKWIKKYIWLLLAFIVVMLVLWLFKIQVFSPLLIFILVALAIRYLFLQQFFKFENLNQ